MTDYELEQRLRSWYRDEIGFTEPGPDGLRDGLDRIAATYPRRLFGSRRSLVLLAAAVLLLVAAIGAAIILSQPTPFPRPGPGPTVQNGVIAFSGQDVETSDFVTYVVNPDGSGLRQITTTPVTGELAWSPDGTRVAFVGTDPPPFLGRNSVMHVMNADGTGDTVVLDTPGEYYGPAWSPDGTQIAFSFLGSGSSAWNVWVMNVDGSNAHALTSHPEGGFDPAWSPDSAQIVFSRDSETVANDLYLIDADGSNVRRLTEADDIKANPAWSPDGPLIAFGRRSIPPGGGNISSFNPPWDIWTVSIDDGTLIQLTDDPESELQPAWSPDGAKIVFGTSGWPSPLYVMNADGSNVEAIDLTGVPESVLAFPSWAAAAD